MLRAVPRHNQEAKEPADKIVQLGDLAAIRERHGRERIVQCHGVFDLLHPGHIAYFESAKKHGDVLVVTVTADRYVNKGPRHPHFPASVRAKVLSSLEVVDYVCVSDFPTAVQTIQGLKPDFYAKGPDYQDKASDKTGGILLEEQAVRKHGGKLVFTHDEVYSSSKLLHQYLGIWSEDQNAAIETVKKAGGIEEIERVLARIAAERVLVVGEPIVDTYVFCDPQAISSKSPSVSAKFVLRENYAGGSLAIANHLCDFVDKVTLITTHGGEDYFKALIKDSLDPRITIRAVELEGVPTPQKTRFLTRATNQHLFEITNIRYDQWGQFPSEDFSDLLLRARKKASTTLVADFGHGLLEGPVLSALELLSGFVALNVQTNSSNLGFNPFTKHKNYSYLSADAREVQLAFHDRFTAPVELARRIRREREGVSVALTLGPEGSYYFPARDTAEHRVPAFSDGIIDTTGAGDAFFAITSMLARVGCPDVMVAFIGNVFAGLKTKIIGNKKAVPKGHLMKALATILK